MHDSSLLSAGKGNVKLLQVQAGSKLYYREVEWFVCLAKPNAACSCSKLLALI